VKWEGLLLAVVGVIVVTAAVAVVVGVGGSCRGSSDCRRRLCAPLHVPEPLGVPVEWALTGGARCGGQVTGHTGLRQAAK
jgi:hypothetical protein